MGIVTYLSLNVLVTVIVLLVLKPWIRQPRRTTLSIALHLIVMTAVFDSLIIWLGIVAYDPAKILGLKIALAPVEDFFYAIVAAVMVPAIWRRLGER